MRMIKYGMVVAMVAGCGVEGGSSTGDTPLPPPMASADRAGAHIDVYQLTPGTLAVVATGDVPDGLDGKTPVEVYEKIAGAPAPAALVARQAAIVAVRSLHPGDHVGTADAAAPDRAKGASLTGAAFQSSYCNPGAVDFDYCFLNRTNDYVAWFYNINWIHSHVNCYSGTLTHALWYRAALGSWKLIDVDMTTSSSYVSTFEELDNGDYEVSLTSAAGDGYHLSMHGDN